MNEEEARKILGFIVDHDTGALDSYRENVPQESNWEFVRFFPGGEQVHLDGWFTVEQLKAIVWWLENKK